MKAALIGCSGIAGAHIAGWAACEEADVVYLCDTNREAAEAAREHHFPKAKIVSDHRDLLGQDDFDAVDICTPTRFHAPMSLDFHRDGKHVMVEKPLCTDMAEADTLLAEISDDGPVFMVEHRWLFEPAFMSLAQHLDRLGPLHWMRMRLAHKLPLSPGVAATGCFMDMGYHLVYTALHLMGPAEDVYARATDFVVPDATDDSGLYILSHARGTSVLEASFSSFGPSGLYRGIELYGHNGSAMVTVAPETALWLTVDEKTVEKQALPVTSPWNYNVINHFVNVCSGSAPNIAGIREGYAAMEVISRAT